MDRGGVTIGSCARGGVGFAARGEGWLGERGEAGCGERGGVNGPRSERPSTISSFASGPSASEDMDEMNRAESERAGVPRGLCEARGLPACEAIVLLRVGLCAGLSCALRAAYAGERAGLAGCEETFERAGLDGLRNCADDSRTSDRAGLGAAEVELARVLSPLPTGDAATKAASSGLTSPRAPGASEARKEALSCRRLAPPGDVTARELDGDIEYPACERAGERAGERTGERAGEPRSMDDCALEVRRDLTSSNTSFCIPLRKLALSWGRGMWF